MITHQQRHGGDWALWSGSISCSVQSSRTAKRSGPDGQSPLPKKISAISRLPPPKQRRHPRRDAFIARMIITAWLPNDPCGICGLTLV
jgi:hypothetical protein